MVTAKPKVFMNRARQKRRLRVVGTITKGLVDDCLVMVSSVNTVTSLRYAMLIIVCGRLGEHHLQLNLIMGN